MNPKLGDYRFWFWAGLGLWASTRGRYDKWQKGQPSIWETIWARPSHILLANKAWPLPHQAC